MNPMAEHVCRSPTHTDQGSKLKRSRNVTGERWHLTVFCVCHPAKRHTENLFSKYGIINGPLKNTPGLFLLLIIVCLFIHLFVVVFVAVAVVVVLPVGKQCF